MTTNIRKQKALALTLLYLEQLQLKEKHNINLRPETAQALFQWQKNIHHQELSNLLPTQPSPNRPFISKAPPAPATQALKALDTQPLQELLNQLKSTSPTTLSPTFIPGHGPTGATIAFVGEHPHLEDEPLLTPFNHLAAKKLNGIISAMGLQRTQVYLTLACKQRPIHSENQPHLSRQPNEAEILHWKPFLHQELNNLRPKIIIALGLTAAKALGLDGSISATREKIFPFQNSKLIVTFPPESILREEKISADKGATIKKQVWQDMLKAMEIAELTITEKQRSYFK
jgi:uracil-DNA glycosylase family 4